jgi:SM-20-related protein
MIDSQIDLHLIEKFFDEETCRELIAEMARSASAAAVIYGRDESGAVDQRVRKVARLQLLPQTVEYVRQRLIECRESLGKHFGMTVQSCEEPQFLRYQVGDFFVAHQDGNTGMVALASDASRRISVSIFLNGETETPQTNSYCGGSLVLSDWRAASKLRLIGKAGTLAAFRSETTHEVVPITHGERYSIVSWFG